MTKSDLVNAVHRNTGLSGQESFDMVNSVLETVIKTLERGETVKISSFGQFSVRDKRERIGRNPKTGEEKMISARRVVVFKASQTLRDKVNKKDSKKRKK